MMNDRRGFGSGRYLPGIAVAMLCMAAVVIGGCEERVVGTRYGNAGSSQQAPPPEPSNSDGGWFGFGGGGDNDRSEGQWAVALGQFEGADHRRQAEQRKRELEAATGMNNLWVADEGEVSLLYHGRYPSARDRQARADLRRWQQLAGSGQVRLPVLMLTPISSERQGSMPEYNLRNASGDRPYTLQIGFYDERFGENFREAAEKAAAALRRDGEEAYYYHGRNRSLVTIGTFGETTLRFSRENNVSPYTPEVKALQRKFPYNMANGVTLRETRPSGETREQPSFLVRIPHGG